MIKTILRVPLLWLILVGGSAVGATINEKFEAYGLLIGTYESAQYLSNECSRRYPTVRRLADTVKREYIRRNEAAFAETEKYMIALAIRERGASLKDFQDLMDQLRPDLDKIIKVATQKYIGSKESCSAALRGVSNGKMDLLVNASRQIEIIGVLLEWRVVGTDPSTKVGTYADPRSIAKTGSQAKITYLFNLPSPQASPSGKYRSLKVEGEFDCLAKKSRKRLTTAYKGPMANGEVLVSEAASTEWESITMGTPLESLLYIACRG